MSKRDKLARGGAIVRPLLANGKRPEILVFFNLRTQRLYEEIYQKLTGRETRFKSVYVALAESAKLGTYTLPVIETIAILGAAALGRPLKKTVKGKIFKKETVEELTLDDIEDSTLSQIDKDRIVISLFASLPQLQDEFKDWDKINNAKTSEDLTKDFFTPSFLKRLASLA